MPIHWIWRLWNTLYMYDMDYGCVIHSGWVWSHIACVMVWFAVWFPKSGLAPAWIMKWWWIHMPIHCIWRLCNTLYMYDMDVWSTLGGSEASLLVLWYGLQLNSDPGFWLISQIWASTCLNNEVVMDPYAHPLHMKVVKHLVYVWYGCVIHSGWVMSLNACVVVRFVDQQWPRILADFPNLGYHLPW